MKDVVFVTGNQRKANYLNSLLGFEIAHEKVDLDEIQSNNLETVACDKARRAYDILQRPVLVEDVGLEFDALDGLPGAFIKFFVQKEKSLEKCCRMLDGFSSRKAQARSVFVYFDGREEKIFKGGLFGEIADHPKGVNGWDWDFIFCPDGYDGRTRAELNEKEDFETYLTIKPIKALQSFLESLS